MKNPEIFSTAFLDTVSCGLGAVLILMIVFASMIQSSKKAPKTVEKGTNTVYTSEQQQLVHLLVDIESDSERVFGYEVKGAINEATQKIADIKVAEKEKFTKRIWMSYTSEKEIGKIVLEHPNRLKATINVKLITHDIQKAQLTTGKAAILLLNHQLLLHHER